MVLCGFEHIVSHSQLGFDCLPACPPVFCGCFNQFLVSFREIGRPMTETIESLTETCNDIDPDDELSSAFTVVQSVLSSSPKKRLSPQKQKRIRCNAASLAMSLHSLSVRTAREKLHEVDGILLEIIV